MPLAAATTLVVALKAGELAIRSTLGRPLNPLLDLDLAPSLVHLLAGTLGAWRTGLLLAGAALALLLVLGLSVVAIGIAQRALAGPRPRALMLALGILLLALFGLGQTAPRLVTWLPVSAHASDMLLAQWRLGRDAVHDQARLEAAMASDPFRDLPAGVLLTRLAGIDVLLIYVESYGRSALEQPRYAATIATEAGGVRAGARGARARRGIGLPHVAHGGRPVLARARHDPERPLAAASARLQRPGAKRLADAHQSLRQGRPPHARGQAGDHHAVARRRADGL